MQVHSVQSLSKVLGDQFYVIGDQNAGFSNAKAIDVADEDSLVWLAPYRADRLELAKNTKAKIIICDAEVEAHAAELPGKCLVITQDPRLAFLRAVDHFFKAPPVWGIHPSAVIHPEAQVHESCFIGPLTYIGKAQIGKGTVIAGSCFIYDNVTIGENVLIHAGTVIGADGFGYRRNENGELEKFPHIGGVVIENNVEIGSNTCIDKGTLGNTLIMEGAKIDNLVHIAHNVIIGKSAAVIAHAMIGGSTRIGENAWIAPNAALRDGLSIGKQATVGLGSVVTKNIPENETWIGVPAKEISQARKK